MGRLTVWLGLLFISIGVSAAQAQSTIYTVTDLGTLGGDWAAANAINDIGQVVGSSQTGGTAPAYHAFVYEKGGITDIGTLGGTFAQANGINNRGQIVGYSNIARDSDFHAFLYSDATMTDLRTLGGPWSIANGINDSGQIVGRSRIASSPWTSFLYEAGSMKDLGPFGKDAFGEARALNGSGQVVGYARGNSNTNPFAYRYDHAVMTSLVPPSNYASAANGINDAGQIVGTWHGPSTSGWDHAVLFKGGSLIDINALGGRQSSANAINAKNQVVGYFDRADASGGFQQHAFIYQDGKMNELVDFVDRSGNGWSLSGATSINQSGQIVGYGYNPQGKQRAFLLTPTALPVQVAVPPLNPGAAKLPPPATGVMTGSLLHWNGSEWKPLTAASQLDSAEKQKPTVVMTHGWHGSIDATFTQEAQELGSGFDVLAWDWASDANPYNYSSPLEDVNDRGLTGASVATSNGTYQGVILSRDLLTLGVDPAQMQLIGHSSGAAVIGSAAKNLQSRTGKQVERLTLLDAPNLQLKEVPEAVIEPLVERVVNPLYVDPLFYLKWGTTSVNALQYVDSRTAKQVEVFYSSSRFSLGFGTAMSDSAGTGNIWNGDVYPGSGLGQLTQGGEHTRMTGWYANVRPNLPSFLPEGSYSEQGANTGIFGSKTLKEQGAGTIKPILIVTFNDAVQWFGQHAEPVFQAGSYLMHLFEGSDAYLFRELEIPTGTDYMTFDFKIDAAGDGDYLSVSFGDHLLSLVDLNSISNGFVTSDPVYVGNLAGQTGTFLFALNSQGAVNSSMYLDHVVFGAVPEPTGLAMLAVGLTLLNRRRRAA